MGLGRGTYPKLVPELLPSQWDDSALMYGAVSLLWLHISR